MTEHNSTIYIFLILSNSCAISRHPQTVRYWGLRISNEGFSVPADILYWFDCKNIFHKILYKIPRFPFLKWKYLMISYIIFIKGEIKISKYGVLSPTCIKFYNYRQYRSLWEWINFHSISIYISKVYCKFLSLSYRSWTRHTHFTRSWVELMKYKDILYNVCSCYSEIICNSY